MQKRESPPELLREARRSDFVSLYISQAKKPKLLKLAEARASTSGAKAAACAELARLAGASGGKFSAPAGVVLPFGTMDAALQVSVVICWTFELQSQWWVRSAFRVVLPFGIMNAAVQLSMRPPPPPPPPPHASSCKVHLQQEVCSAGTMLACGTLPATRRMLP